MVDGIEIGLTFLLSLLFVYTITKISEHMGMIDIPNERSSHINPIPRGAGVGIFLAFIIVLLLFHMPFVLKYKGFILGSLLIFLTGVYDDNRSVSPKVKFIAIIIATLLIYFLDDMKIGTLGVWFGHEIILPAYIALPVTVIAVVGFTNAMNLIDGLDGLSGSVAIVIFGAFYYLGLMHHDTFIMTVSILMIAAIIAFLFFNWHPAMIFMGDSGSLILGFTIAVVAIKSISYVSITSVLFLTAIPIIDTLTVMVRRIQRSLSPFNPDKTHLHHKVLRWKGGVDNAVVLIVLIQFIFSVMGLALRRQPDNIVFFIFFVILILAFTVLDERAVARERTIITRIRKSGIQIKKKYLNKNIIFSALIISILVLLYMKLI
ncbi:MAG: undecaprenyl/decaprenyl-phosphate alpha-N-acetylglucosaminyl 1-phosphate transferase [Sulfurospirillum sp.]|nr:MAG: undecaprenyl/decaprenyl-phosphate alpha-N-acetylglucosaminyl 1-phosphate transferase [Sulfurospirillum sp.]